MYVVRKSLPSDLITISVCHHICFPKSFSKNLGLAYTRKTFEWFLLSDNRFLYHISSGNRVIGYIGGLNPQFTGDGSTSGMMRIAMKEASAGIAKKPWLLFKKEMISFYPLILKNLYGKIFSGNIISQPQNFSSEFFEQKVGLVVVGVHPDERGKGIFEALNEKFENEARRRNISKLILSVKKDNLRAIKTYTKAGWLISKENITSLEMYKII